MQLREDDKKPRVSYMDSDDVEVLRAELNDLKVQVKYLKWTVQYVILPILLVILGKLILP